MLVAVKDFMPIACHCWISSCQNKNFKLSPQELFCEATTFTFYVLFLCCIINATTTFLWCCKMCVATSLVKIVQARLPDFIILVLLSITASSDRAVTLNCFQGVQLYDRDESNLFYCSFLLILKLSPYGHHDDEKIQNQWEKIMKNSWWTCDIVMKPSCTSGIRSHSVANFLGDSFTRLASYFNQTRLLIRQDY